MNLESYEVEGDDNSLLFEFVSVGPKGRITKIIQYAKADIPNFYNLGFGDKNPFTGSVDDKAISNNGDSQKVLATIANN